MLTGSWRKLFEEGRSPGEATPCDSLTSRAPTEGHLQGPRPHDSDLHPATMSYEPSVNGSVAASTAGSELDFGGETEAHYTLPSLTDLVRKSSTPKEPAMPAHRGAPTEAPAAGVQRPAAAYSHGSGVMWPYY